ncbi:hypothetical protein R1flu_012671 [Riccia fluitans]|uniref:Uncharacterized protein n=1 Tax=Riccia fluitans TaxID=41844 RepID=A0ABD1ZCE4_9MARC
MVKRVEEMQESRQQQCMILSSELKSRQNKDALFELCGLQSWCNIASLFCLDLSAERIVHCCCRLSCICTLHLLPCPAAIAVPYGRPSRGVTHPSIIPVKQHLTLEFQGDKVV